jgi:peptide/nickel transport system ATP-binding protein
VTLAIRELVVSYGGRRVVAVDRLDLDHGEILGLAGESGSGKSSVAAAILGLGAYQGGAVSGSIMLGGRELVGLGERALRGIRGSRVAIILQNPVATFNPTIRIGHMFQRALRLHGATRKEALHRAERAMADVLLPPALLRRYPHEVSGGQAQRMAIALAVALDAELLVADEPTSALDVTVQREILQILSRLRDQRQLSLLFISHDLAVLGELCDHIAVMKDGRIVERGPAARVLREPTDAYTRELVAAVPMLRTTTHVMSEHA